MADSHRIFAATYDRLTAPIERRALGPRRRRLLGELRGHVLDIGAGTGANLPYLTSAARVVAVEPDSAMRARLVRKLSYAPVPVEVNDGSAEALPFADNSFDAAVFTLVLCSVAHPDVALAEARRVLTPSGRLVVLEHVRGDGALGRRQDRWTPLWSRLAAGCQLNRDTRADIEAAGFEFTDVETFAELPSWVLTRSMLQGIAVAPDR